MSGAFVNFSPESFSWFRENEWPDYKLFDKGILTVFQEDREHERIGATRTKFLLLDKAYSAGLRRWVQVCKPGQRVEVCSYLSEDGSCGYKCDPVWTFLNRLRGEDPDSVFRQTMSRACRLDSELSSELIDEVVELHTTFSRAISEQARDGGSIQSFCAKYLWFHAGVFPVYDALAKKGLRALQKRGAPKYEQYREFARDVLELLKVVFGKHSFTREEVKLVDGYLTWIGADKTRISEA